MKNTVITLVLMAAVMGFALQANAATTIFTADFEDSEVNPGRWPDSGVINTTAYSTTQPEAFSTAPGAEADGDAFGWQNRTTTGLAGDTIVVDTQAYTGSNSAEVQGRTLRTDIPHTLAANSIYTFTYWVMVPSGNSLTFYNKVVCKDQTNNFLFVDTDLTGDQYTTAPDHDTWFARKVKFDTTGYANVGVPIDLRFGIWVGANGVNALVYTDNWSVTYEPANTFLDASLTYNPDANDIDISVAWSDINKDGLTDLYAGSINATEAGLFMNSNPFNPTLAPADDIGAGPGANHPGLMVDYDNDGDIDMYTSQAGAHASRNNSDGTFTEINGGLLTPSAVVAITGVPSECHAWGDFDNDGYLDYYRSGWEVAPDGPYYPDGIFMNNAGSSFDVSWFQDTVGDWNEGVGDRRSGRGVTVADFDEDGDVDIYVSNYRLAPNYLWLNDGNANFADVAETYGVAGDVNGAYETYTWGHSIGSAWGDLDNDGHLDLVVGNFSHSDPDQDRPKFYRNMGPGGSWHFEDKSSTVSLPYVESHASPTLGDFDNDGDLDVFITAVSGAGYPGQKSTLMRNDGNWNFTDISVAQGLDLATAHTNFQAAWADYDNDGDLDLFTGRKLYKNNLASDNHWLKIKLHAFGRDINTQAVGAQVRIDLGGGVILTRQVEAGTGWGNQNDMNLHFGLGSEAGPVDIEVTWPNGETQIVNDIAVDQQIAIGEQTFADDLVIYRNSADGPGGWRATNTLADPDHPYGWPYGGYVPDPNYFFDDPGYVSDSNEMTVNSTLTSWGLTVSKPVMGDVNGDGSDDIAVFHSNGALGYAWAAAHTVDNGGTGAIDNTTTSTSGFPPRIAGVDLGPVGAFLADINGDGYDDAVMVDYGFNWFVCYSDENGLEHFVDDTVQFGLGNGGDTPFVGDFNGDGYDDICLHRKPGSWYILLSKNDGSGFGDAGVDMKIAAWGASFWDTPLVGDVNGDGRCDVAFASHDHPTNAGNGLIRWIAAYTDPNGMPAGDGSTSQVNFGLKDIDTPLLADFDGDGRVDITITRVNPVSGAILWYTGFTIEDIQLGKVTLYAGAVGDDNGNFGTAGRDIAVIGDLDSDNDQDDIVLYRPIPGEVNWYGSRTRQDPTYLHNVTDTQLVGSTPKTNYAPLMGDVNGDGIDDIVTLSEGPRWQAYHSEVTADGTGILSDAVRSSIAKFGGETTNIVELFLGVDNDIAHFLGDINGDSADDAITVDSGYNWSAAHSIPGSGLDDTIISSVQFGLPGDIPLIGDFNGDGIVDICVRRDSSTQFFTSMSDSSGLGGGASFVGAVGAAGEWEHFLVGDINGDGHDDIVFVDSDDSVILNESNSPGQMVWIACYADSSGLITFTPAPDGSMSNYAVFGLNTDVPFVADINRDGMSDIGVNRPSGAARRSYVNFTTVGGLLGTNGAGDEWSNFGLAADLPPLVAVLGNEVCSIWDLSGDCTVNLVDFAEFSEFWIDGYDIDDLVELAEDWLY